MANASRVPNWDCLLVEWARSVIGLPFEWGVTDCATLVRESQAIIYGVDPFAGVARWKTKRKALRIALETGGVIANMEAVGCIEVPLTFAQAGDVLLSPGGDANGLPQSGVLAYASRVLTSNETDGVRLVPMSALRPGTIALRLSSE